MDYSPKKMTDLLNKNNFNFKKKFGQNFIVDENIIDNIIIKSMIDKETYILEIGPGAGSLTLKLAQNSKGVLCYEIDDTLKEILNSNLKGMNNVNIIYEDFLKANVKAELDKIHSNKIFVVANLPYYITTPIIMKIINDKLNIDKIVIMVQKEVGNRFKAIPGTKDYNSLSIYLNYYYDIKKLMDVSRNVFLPRPNVDSIIIELSKKERKLNVNEEIFFKLIKDSFTQKRKTLKNNLKDYDLNLILDVLEKHNLNLEVRAEQIPIEIYIEIANKLGGKNGR